MYSSSLIKVTLSAKDRDHFRKLQPIKMQHCGAGPYICSSGSGNTGRGGWRTARAKGSQFAMRVSPSRVRSYTHEDSPTWLPKHELSKYYTSGHAKVDGEEPWGLNPTQSIYNWGKLDSRGILGESTPTGAPVPNGVGRDLERREGGK